MLKTNNLLKKGRNKKKCKYHESDKKKKEMLTGTPGIS